ncbi:MAG TPA: hypothetical protein VMC43_02315 [Candidatus Paceibacterota bacterium]|nr:hypothetical protein [Candidatus Paceibacterota bacterium]
MDIPKPPDLGQFGVPLTITGIRYIIMLVDFMLFFGTIYALVQSWTYRTKLDVNAAPKKHVLTLRSQMYRERWQKILQGLQLGTPEAMRLAVIDADTLIDDALKNLGLPGEHMADRLSQFHLSSEEMHSLNGVWEAHRLRNEIVHTPGFAVSGEDVQDALNKYEAFLKELGLV